MVTEQKYTAVIECFIFEPGGSKGRNRLKVMRD